ncbi:LemA family protein [Echinicola shivajiensis]|uniref:LemA family protein n=1 Tax=Echinicola shivajiensis TaxID=1035916 RepID=UPI001BFC7214|nr:LemA family protein [Echinicola shivajiensis]
MIVEIILLALALAVIICSVVVNNQIVARKNQVTQAFGSIQIYLKQRFDLIPNLVTLLKQYLAHEKEILLQVTALRSQVKEANEAEEKIEASNELTKLMGYLRLNVEQYPNLKADKQFSDIQYELSNIEEQISAARRAYNAAVTAYNNTIEMFPANIVAGIRKDQAKPLLDIPEAEQKEVNINQLFNS